MATGVSFSINVSAIDKSKIIAGKKGNYVNMTCFINDEQDQYGNNGMVTQSVSKEEREQGVKGNILGNVKVFYTTDAQAPVAPSHAGQPVVGGGIDPDIEIPFAMHMKNTIA